MRLYAHSLGQMESDWQPLFKHLENVSSLTADFAGRFDAAEWGAAAGALHDLGKASSEFQKKLRGENRRVDHSTAGAQEAARRFKAAGRLLAACIAGHHGGLQDGKSREDSSLAARLIKKVPALLAAEPTPIPSTLPGRSPFRQDRARLGFQFSFFVRMLFSCLVDADFLDTERFMNPEEAKQRERFSPLSELERRFRARFDLRFSRPLPTEINQRRAEIYDACIARSQDPQGLFSLTVPTGGGKTLSSLAFALSHALHHGLDRIIYVIPFTGIIEQTAEVFREFVGSDDVLEHHSAFDPRGRVPDEGSEEDERARQFELAAENWDAPLVVTTAVQFFESLFAHRTSKCRKLHNIARSVVILDEAQMLPPPFLLPCLFSIRELAENYRTSVVLCTATQPALGKTPEFTQGIEDVREIMRDPRALYEAFRRVNIENAGPLSLDKVSDLLRENERMLCIVNTRTEARRVFEQIRNVEGAFHLTALMCPAHRSEKLKEIKERLGKKLPCRVVSTRLIEAGVDVDFPVVARAMSGIDSIAQAAGRCNREGKLPRGRLIVYTPEGGLSRGDLRPPAQTALEIMRKHEDILSLDAVEDYFRLLYWEAGERLDEKRILKKLAENLGDLLFPFREVSKDFRLISEQGETVIVPFTCGACTIIAELRYAEFPGRLLRKAQRFSVQVPYWAFSRLKAAGAIEYLQEICPALTEYGFERFYDEDAGLLLDIPDPNPESLYVDW